MMICFVHGFRRRCIESLDLGCTLRHNNADEPEPYQSRYSLRSFKRTPDPVVLAFRVEGLAMRTLMPTGAILLAACCSVALAQSNVGQRILPVIELQSRPLTPGLVLDESARPIHQVRVLIDAKLKRGTLILDGSLPEFNEFGVVVGGIQTPQIRDNGNPQFLVQLDCIIESVKEGPDEWRLYRVTGQKIRTPLRIATRGSIADGGPARLVILDRDDKVKTVVECIRYGLVIP
jgi:hypothetical protein